MMYYLILSEYTGPDTLDSNGDPVGDTRRMVIQDSPPQTNLDHRERTSGWLGTTNDMAQYALGAYTTIEAARCVAQDEGCTDPTETESHEIEAWQPEAMEREPWDADEWLLSWNSPENICEIHGITADTTDEAVTDIAARIEADARQEGVRLSGTADTICDCRDLLRDRD